MTRDTVPLIFKTFFFAIIVLFFWQNNYELSNAKIKKKAVEPRAVDPHCFDADPEPDPAQNLEPDPDPDPGGGGVSAVLGIREILLRARIPNTDIW